LPAAAAALILNARPAPFPLPMTQSAFLLLEDDTLLQGRSIGHAGCSVGEVVFNTAMTG